LNVAKKGGVSYAGKVDFKKELKGLYGIKA